MTHWRREWQTTPVFLLPEPHEQYEKAKDMTSADEPPPPTSGQKLSNTLLGKSGGQLLIAPERMKQLGQSGNDAQLWMCLVVKVKSDAAKNSAEQEPGMLHP